MKLVKLVLGFWEENVSTLWSHSDDGGSEVGEAVMAQSHPAGSCNVSDSDCYLSLTVLFIRSHLAKAVLSELSEYHYSNLPFARSSKMIPL